MPHLSEGDDLRPMCGVDPCASFSDGGVPRPREAEHGDQCEVVWVLGVAGGAERRLELQVGQTQGGRLRKGLAGDARVQRVSVQAARR